MVEQRADQEDRLSRNRLRAERLRVGSGHVSAKGRRRMTTTVTAPAAPPPGGGLWEAATAAPPHGRPCPLLRHPLHPPDNPSATGNMMEDRTSDPKAARVGAIETPSGAGGRRIGRGVLPLAALGRSTSPGRSEGIARVIFDEADDRAIGASMVGPSAGDLIAAAARAIGTGAHAVDPGCSIHPRPTPSETVNLVAGTTGDAAADLNLPKRRS
ncbi:hypothetical protein H5395_13340 [Paracoccus sp. MC1854]|nr:hypothetical protein [Paracoccus sp. MC1854]